MARAGEIESYNPGEAIVVEGSLGDALFLILSGQVAVHRGAQTFATLAGGEFFGEMSLVEPAPRSASVTAMSATFLFRLPHDALRELITDDPQRRVDPARPGRQDALGAAAPREPDAVVGRHARRLARRLDGVSPPAARRPPTWRRGRRSRGA